MAPHAPLLLPEVAGSKNASRTGSVGHAVASLDLGRPDVVVIASPHGRSSGVYSGCAGDLDAFGPRGIEVAAETEPDVVASLAAAWGTTVVDERVDHGVVVPLRLLRAGGAAVVAISFAEGLEADEAVAEGEALAAALRDVASGTRVAFVASANLSAGHGERAPLPSIEGAAETDAAVIRCLRDEPAGLSGLAAALAAGGSCAAAPLAAFGMLFGGRRCDVLAYDHPFGVGHAVASAR